jgi:hypothetical protein
VLSGQPVQNLKSINMKKFIPFLSLAFLITACNSKPSEAETRTLQSTQPAGAALDTAGLAQFQQWKAQNELAAATPVQQEQAPAEQAPVKTVTTVREVRVKQPATARQPARQTPRPVQQSAPAETKTENTGTGNSDVASNNGSGAGTADAPATQPEAEKKGGMSNATKGAVIGSAGGAVIGAVINKRNRGVGAVIGGVIGGAAGYGLGKKKDKKDSL